MDYLNYFSSILFLTVMSVDRLMATVYLIKTRIYRTRKNAIYICVVVWMIAFAAATPFGYYARVHKKYKANHTDCNCVYPGSQLHELLGKTEEEIKAEVYDEVYHYKQQFDSDFDHYSEVTYDETGEPILPVNVTYDDDERASGDADDPLYFSWALDDYEAYDGMEIPDCKLRQNTRGSEFYRIYMWLKFFFFYVIPVTLIVGSYVAILTTANKRLNRMPDRQKKMRKHMTVTILAMVMAFIVCWSPFLIWNFALAQGKITSRFKGDCDLYMNVFEMIAFANSAINPILYWLVSKSFQQKIRAVYEYLTTGRNLKSLVIKRKQESVNTRISTVKASTSAVKSRDQVLLKLNPHLEESKDEMETTLIKNPSQK